MISGIALLLLALALYSTIGFLFYMLFRTVLEDLSNFTRDQDHAYALLCAITWPVSTPVGVVVGVCCAAYHLCKHLIDSYRVISTHLGEVFSANK